jgi:cadmium resistance protein CadD (predicted permease)
LEEKREYREEKREESELTNNWESCCFTLDRRAVQFFSSVGIIAVSMGFSMWQLTHLPVEEAQPYLGILSLCLGVAIDRPKLDET